jgi:hypothetical protein
MGVRAPPTADNSAASDSRTVFLGSVGTNVLKSPNVRIDRIPITVVGLEWVAIIQENVQEFCMDCREAKT